MRHCDGLEVRLYTTDGVESLSACLMELAIQAAIMAETSYAEAVTVHYTDKAWYGVLVMT